MSFKATRQHPFSFLFTSQHAPHAPPAFRHDLSQRHSGSFPSPFLRRLAHFILPISPRLLPIRPPSHLECPGLQPSILPASTCPTPSRLPTSCPRPSHHASHTFKQTPSSHVAPCHVKSRHVTLQRVYIPHPTSAWLTVLAEAQGRAAGKSRIAPRFLHPGHLVISITSQATFFPASPAKGHSPDPRPGTSYHRAHRNLHYGCILIGGWLQGKEGGPRRKSSSDSASKGTTQGPRGRAGDRSLGGLARELPSHI